MAGRPTRALGLVGVLLIALVAVALSMAPLPAYTVVPGESIALSTSMTVDGTAATDVLNGDFLVTTIALGDADVADLVRSWADPDLRVVPRTAFVETGVDEDAFVAEQRARFAASMATAGDVAGELAGGDPVVVAVAGDRVGGPSAGLTAALAAYDVLDADDLAAGRSIAATGEIRPDGTVVGVGSVADKVRGAAAAGAAMFLVPSGQVEAARDAVPVGVAMEVVGVDTVAEAVAVLSAR